LNDTRTNSKFIKNEKSSLEIRDILKENKLFLEGVRMPFQAD
jgi:hypothetical protein